VVEERRLRNACYKSWSAVVVEGSRCVSMGDGKPALTSFSCSIRWEGDVVQAQMQMQMQIATKRSDSIHGLPHHRKNGVQGRGRIGASPDF
jgi:hypothetical protein